MQARFNWETMAETQTETESQTETASPAERTPLRLPGVLCGKGQREREARRLALASFCVCWRNISVIAFFKLWNQSKMSMSRNRGMPVQKWPILAATTCAPIFVGAAAYSVCSCPH